jgi:uncharacterized cupredoxin-like copper-binding protein
MKLKPVVAVAAALLVVPVIAACGSASGETSSTPAASTPAPAPAATPTTAAPKAAASTGPVDVSLSEWKIAPSTPTVKAGKVTFDVKNAGAVPHEMVVIKTDKPAGGLGSGSRVSEKGSVGEVSDVAPGASGTKTLKLKPGKYVLICNLPGHYMQGMHTAFTVS